MRYAILGLFAASCLTFGFVAPCHADGSGSAAVLVDAGVPHDAGPLAVSVDAGIATGPIVLAPPVNPVTDPSGYISELANAKANGWAALLMVIVFGLCEIAAKAGSTVPALAWLGKGRISIVIGGGIAVGAAAIAALSSSGTWLACGYAAVAAALLYAHPAAKDVAIDQVAKAAAK